MLDDNERGSGNFDSIPNISFDNNGQPVNGNFGNNSFPQFGGDNMHNGQFIPPMQLQLNENNSMDMEITNSINNTNNTNTNFNNNENVNTQEVAVSSGLNMFVCGDCNTVFGVNGGMANECIMCHGNNITPSQEIDINIDGFIPFKVSKNKAVDDYKSKIMYNPVVPMAFKSKKIINSMKRVYIPGYLYDSVTSGNVNLLGADNTPNGKLTFDVGYKVSVEYNNVFYKLCSKINERVFNAVGNYTFNDITYFDTTNLGQCHLLANDLNKLDIDAKMEDNCKKHIMAMARKKVNHQMKKIQDNDLSTQVNRVSCVLVPVYFLNVKYNNKDYMYIMNGENGKSSLDVTNGKLEMLIFGLIVGLLVFGISVLLSIMF